MEMQPVGMQLDDPTIEKVIAYIGTFSPKAPPATVTGDAKRGKALYVTCSGCHGTKGEGSVALKSPALAGQTDWYLVTQLERFRAGERGFMPEDEQGTQMRAASSVLPDKAAVHDVVAYINTLTQRRGT
jgi:cytochrome c oxidase subunit 2